MIMSKSKLQLIFSLFTLLSLSGCGAYSSTFNCPDARGLRCRSLSIVDAQIDSGEIETVYKPQCKGMFCKNKNTNDIKPALANKEEIKVKYVK